MTNNRTIGDVAAERANAMRVKGGDMFELITVQDDAAEECTTMQVETTVHGMLLARAWSEATGSVPTREDLALLNAAGRASREVMTVLLEATERVFDQENEAGPAFMSTMVEPFVSTAIASYVVATSRERGSVVQDSGLRDFCAAMMPRLLATAEKFGQLTADRAMGRTGASSDEGATTMGTNGAMLTVQPDETRDRAGDAARMALAKALGAAATGHFKGDA